MRRMLIAAALCLSLWPAAACSSGGTSGDTGKNNTASPGASAGQDGASPGASGSPGATTGGTSTDKAACDAVTAKLSAWGTTFAEIVGRLGSAGNDVKKIEPIVKDAQAANTKFAGELRAEAAKAKDAELKKTAEGLAATLDKINGSLNAQKIAQDPNSLLAIFDSPEFAASAEAFEKICGAS
ncbi:hypothetical protein [Catelliglobosispora koreensis]|uniref:hypothetical protein n=1 Tax=Catelliglobosispora koreensis TaxID=129052 RepID=UPI00039FFF9F|nr:hypothetical protein [Catelliglobosispora koreensis]